MPRSFLESPYIFWCICLAFYIFSIFEQALVPVSSFTYKILKFLFYQVLLIEVLQLKSKNHSFSLTPFTIKLTLRNFMEHFIFGVLGYQRFSFAIRTCWIMIDTIKLLNSIYKNSVTGNMNYWLSICIFIVHGALECISILKASLKQKLLLRSFMGLFFFAYLISLKVLLNHRIYQLMWYKRKKTQKKTK